MSAVPKRHQMRINGFKKNSKFWSYLNASLNRENPNLDYFHFADLYQGTRRATSNHFRDLLIKFSSKQSNKLTKIAQDSMKLFDVSTNTCLHLLTPAKKSNNFHSCSREKMIVSLDTLIKHIGKEEMLIV